MNSAMQRFLAMIAYSEGTLDHPLTGDQKGYNVIVTGIDGPEVFTDYSDHPFAHRPPKVVTLSPLLRSTAAGRYQLLYRYWKTYRLILHLEDFSPASQDAVAVKQIMERGAAGLILTGKIEEAILACAPIWASFPGNSYGQNPHKMETLLSYYESVQILEGTKEQ